MEEQVPVCFEALFLLVIPLGEAYRHKNWMQRKEVRHTCGPQQKLIVFRPRTSNYTWLRVSTSLLIFPLTDQFSWAGFVLSRQLDKKKFQAVVVSPRSYFVFTPLLASTAVGTLEFRTTLESVRARRSGVEYFQGWADDVNLAEKRISIEEATITRPQPSPLTGTAAKGSYDLESDDLPKVKGKLFHLNYDRLVVAVGCYSQTFGTPGVKENALFLKDVVDARKIRKRVLECEWCVMRYKPILTLQVLKQPHCQPPQLSYEGIFSVLLLLVVAVSDSLTPRHKLLTKHSNWCRICSRALGSLQRRPAKAVSNSGTLRKHHNLRRSPKDTPHV